MPINRSGSQRNSRTKATSPVRARASAASPARAQRSAIESITIEQIQTALNNAGFNPGEIDGVWGRRTMQAAKAFQLSRGLKVDGVVGPLTLQALFGLEQAATNAAAAATPAPLVWLEEAKRLVGTREISGRTSNEVILKWAKGLNIDYKDDDIPWCGLFVGHCVGATLPDEQIPNTLLMARSWRTFGEKCAPMTGSILVFWRGSPTGVQGHVGFYHSEDDTSFHVLGGNQSNQVSLARIGKDRLLASRWPRSASILSGSVLFTKSTEKLSHNEA